MKVPILDNALVLLVTALILELPRDLQPPVISYKKTFLSFQRFQVSGTGVKYQILEQKMLLALLLLRNLPDF